MAQRRMFDKDMILSSLFMDMTDTAQITYIRLCANADDEGFVSNPRLVGARKKSLEALEQTGYIYCFKSGTVLIRHWNIHNKLRKDTFRNTTCTAEKALVRLGSDKIYEYISVTEPVQIRNESVPQESIGKESVGKDSTAKESKEQESIAKDKEGERSIGKGNRDESAAAEASGGALCDKEKNFSVFWDEYPKKCNEEEAKQTFMACDEDFDTIMEGLRYNKKSNQWVSDNGFFIPDPKNWLKRKGWKDRPPLYKPKTSAVPMGGSGQLGPEELAAIQRTLAGA